MFQPRPYQLAGHRSTLAAMLDSEKNRVLVVAPTGAGKTLTASMLILDVLRHGGRAIFVAPRKEIINQTYDKLLRDCGVPASQLSVAMADDRRFDPAKPVQVASLDTFRERVWRHDLSADLVIFDEAHRNLTAIRDLSLLYLDSAIVLLTATPWRVDGRGLGEVADRLVVLATVKQLMAGEYLARYEAWSVPKLPDVKGVPIDPMRHDYQQQMLSERSNVPDLIGNMVEHWVERGFGIPTLAAAVDVEHSLSIVKAFNKAGIPAEHVDAKTSDRERERILGNPSLGRPGQLETGDIQVVSSVGITELGLDIPAVKGLIVARRTKSLARHLQFLGRGLRWFMGKICTILDHAGNFELERLPLPDAVLPYALGGSILRSQMPKTVRCRGCYAIYARGLPACPQCGKKAPLGKKKDREVEQADGTLVPFVADSGETFYKEQRQHFTGLIFAGAKYRNPRGVMAWVKACWEKKWQTPMPRSWLAELPQLVQKAKGRT